MRIRPNLTTALDCFHFADSRDLMSVTVNYYGQIFLKFFTGPKTSQPVRYLKTRPNPTLYPTQPIDGLDPCTFLQ